MLYRLISLIFIITVVLTTDSSAEDNHCSLSIMPCPSHISLAKGSFLLNQNINVYFKGMNQHRKEFALAHFGKQLSRLSYFESNGFSEVKNEDTADVVISISNNSLNQKQPSVEYQLPKLGDDESYQLKIEQEKIVIQASSDFGAMHALTTLLQLISNTGKIASLKNEQKQLLLTQLTIIDEPRFQWRGLLIDSVRHFIPLKDIKRQLDGMAAAKLNVFHWHLTDDQGWRVESISYPKLHQLASDNLYYKQSEVKELVAYASLLGIRVVPEFDIPGHASAIAVAYPELITDKKRYKMERQWGVFEPLLDLADENVYQFIDGMVNEFAELFPDKYFHIGGDEVNSKQWLNNDSIKQLMFDENLDDAHDLQRYFNSKVQAILAKYQRNMMGWDEIYHPDLPKNIVVQSWRGSESLNKIANQGYQGILSTGFYIDQPQYSAYHYRNDPVSNVNATKAPLDSIESSKIKLNESEIFRSWQLTIPRLKGTPIKGKFTLIIEVEHGENKSLKGYLKLNNNHYQKVSIQTPSQSLNQDQPKNVMLNFNIDSWMGPLRFELELGSKPNNLKHPSNRVYIGNASYPLIAHEQFYKRLPDLSFAPKLLLENKGNILGGEATLWTELVTKNNIDLRTWPRLFVIAERLWSPKKVNDIDDMHQRLIIMDKYAENTIGLLHKKQQKQGLISLLQSTRSEESLNALIEFLQLLEPAHYYTRHHIKYQQNDYHQLAPLSGLVDYLPVESFELINLNKQIKAYENGNTSALLAIRSKLKKWHSNVEALVYILDEKKQVSQLTPLIEEFKSIHRLTSDIVERCIAKMPYQNKKNEQINNQLKSLSDQQKEAVPAIIPLIQQLLSSCQMQNQHLSQ